jgi:hypothetical protein
LPEDVIKKIHDKTAEVMEPYFERFQENAGRVIDLVQLHNLLKENLSFSGNPAINDILRTSIVFTHATLEDFLRTLAANSLPDATKEVLDQIPLRNVNSKGRAEKFLLGSLVEFKGKTVDDVIQESVLDYLKNSNFNSTGDIAQLLVGIGVDVSKVNSSFSKLDFIHLNLNKKQGMLGRTLAQEVAYAYPADGLYHGLGILCWTVLGSNLEACQDFVDWGHPVSRRADGNGDVAGDWTEPGEAFSKLSSGAESCEVVEPGGESHSVGVADQHLRPARSGDPGFGRHD